MKKEAEVAIEKLVQEESEMRKQIAEEEKKNGGKKKFAGRFKKKGEDEYEEVPDEEEGSEKGFNDPMGELTGFDKPADEIEEIKNEGEE